MVLHDAKTIQKLVGILEYAFANVALDTAVVVIAILKSSSQHSFKVFMDDDNAA